MFTATLFDANKNIVESKNFLIAEHGAEWIASYLTCMAEEGLTASGQIEFVQMAELLDAEPAT